MLDILQLCSAKTCGFYCGENLPVRRKAKKQKKRALCLFRGYLRPATARQHTRNTTTPEAQHACIAIVLTRYVRVAVYRYQSQLNAEHWSSAMDKFFVIRRRLETILECIPLPPLIYYCHKLMSLS